MPVMTKAHPQRLSAFSVTAFSKVQRLFLRRFDPLWV
jgi:hypothetical protein